MINHLNGLIHAATAGGAHLYTRVGYSRSCSKVSSMKAAASYGLL
jgi:hypothetical protein